MCDNFPGAGPVNDGQTNVYPCDTSFIRDEFPCSETGTQPCYGTQVQGWQQGYLAAAGGGSPRYTKKPFTITTNYAYPVILSIVDSYQQAEHYVVLVNGQFAGESGGERGYTNLNSCGRNTDCALNGPWQKNMPYTRGFFLIPPGT